jgi:hypothetical protein
MARDGFIEAEGLDIIEAFGALSGDANMIEMAKWMVSCTANNAGRVILGTIQIKRIEALVFWVKDHERCQMDIDPNAWNNKTTCSKARLCKKYFVLPFLLGRKQTRISKNLISILWTPVSVKLILVGTCGKLCLQTRLVQPWGWPKSHWPMWSVMILQGIMSTRMMRKSGCTR